MSERCNCVGRLGDPLGDMPGPIHERGSPGCVHRLTWSERAAGVALSAVMLGIEVVGWGMRLWKEVRRG
jgi:hypothetical protein